jgi:hypothetical protein
MFAAAGCLKVGKWRIPAALAAGQPVRLLG